METLPYLTAEGDREFAFDAVRLHPAAMSVHHEAGSFTRHLITRTVTAASHAQPEAVQLYSHTLLQRFNTRTDYCHLHMEEGTVIKPQDNPPDDLYADLSEIVAEIIRHMPGHERARIIGYTIISPGPVLPPLAFRVIGDDDSHRLPFETIESEDALFITARLPLAARSPPCVEIMKDEVRIFLDERVAIIRMKFPVDVSSSRYSVRNGVLDITLMKLKKS